VADTHMEPFVRRKPWGPWAGRCGPSINSRLSKPSWEVGTPTGKCRKLLESAVLPENVSSLCFGPCPLLRSLEGTTLSAHWPTLGASPVALWCPGSSFPELSFGVPHLLCPLARMLACPCCWAWYGVRCHTDLGSHGTSTKK
jgi:hypothetical protein